MARNHDQDPRNVQSVNQLREARAAKGRRMGRTVLAATAGLITAGTATFLTGGSVFGDSETESEQNTSIPSNASPEVVNALTGQSPTEIVDPREIEVPDNTVTHTIKAGDSVWGLAPRMAPEAYVRDQESVRAAIQSAVEKSGDHDSVLDPGESIVLDLDQLDQNIADARRSDNIGQQQE